MLATGGQVFFSIAEPRKFGILRTFDNLVEAEKFAVRILTAYPKYGELVCILTEGWPNSAGINLEDADASRRYKYLPASGRVTTEVLKEVVNSL